jgi:hypothetical protein
MEKYNMKKIITLLVLTFIVSISFAQYTPMTAAGYQFKRILCDSTLHIPSFCGVPTLRNSTAKNGAIAIDTCNNKLYKWTRAAGWSEISGGTDTTSLSLRIDQRVKYTDTAAMLLPYMRIIDTTDRFVNAVTKKNDSTITVFKGSSATDITLPRGAAAATPTLQEVTTQGASTTNPIYIDNSNFSHIVLNRPSPSFLDYTDVLAYSSTFDSLSLNGFLIRDSTPGFTSVPNVYAYGQVGAANSDYSFGIENNNTYGAVPFLKFNGGGKIFSLNESSIYFNNGNGYSLKWNIPIASSSDTYMPVSINGIFPDNTGNINITAGSGTVTDISQGYGITASPTNPITTSGTIDVDTTTSGLSGKYLRIVDTTDKWVSNISRTIGKDSIIFFIGSTRYAIKDSVGTNPSPVGYYGAFQDNTSQTAASINTAYPVKFNTTDLTNGVSVVNDGSSNPTRITLANTGIYNIQFSLQLEKTGGSGNMIADIWVRKNGVDIPSTTGKVVLTGSANASPVIAAWNYVLDLAAGDYVQLMWATSNTNVEIVAATATSPHPAIPSSILTVTQQSGIMAGTGITAINSLTGAAQTMVTGTDSTDFRIVSTGTTHKFNLPTASATNRGALSSTDWTTFNNKQSSLTFSTGLTNSSGTVTSNLSTGVSGGQSVVGGTAASDSLTISSTTNATKGKIKFGISAYDEVNNRLGIQQTTPLSKLHINANQNSGSSDDANGILLANTSAAISGTQSASPPTVWQGNGWKTNTTPASQDVRFKAYVLPVQGTTNPSGTWTLASSINGATYINRYQASSAGTHTFYDNSGTSLLTLNNTGTITMGNGQISSLASITASTQFKSGSATSTSAYRTFNGGSDITPTAFFGASETNTAGTLAYATDVNNGLSFTAGNGTRQIARAGINIASLTNTAGAETGDLTFSTQNNGAVMTEKMRIFAAGNVAIGTTTNAGYKLDLNGTARVQGALNFNPTNTASGTTGNQTINKASGTVNIAASGTTVTVTNSLVTASSIVYAVIRTNDATATIKNVVPAAGSFVINLGAAATAEVSIGFFVIN